MYIKTILSNQWIPSKRDILKNIIIVRSVKRQQNNMSKKIQNAMNVYGYIVLSVSKWINIYNSVVIIVIMIDGIDDV